jgi:hypothetical protein
MIKVSMYNAEWVSKGEYVQIYISIKTNKPSETCNKVLYYAGIFNNRLSESI